MKILFTIFMLCIFQLIYAQQTFKAVTYNIRWNNLEDTEDLWDNRRDAIGNFLVEEGADFIGLQEAMEDQVYFIDKYLPDYDYVGVGRDDGKIKGEFCPLFYNTLQWKILDKSTIWLSETPQEVSRGWDAACNRVVSYGLFENIKSGDTIAVFNTHFDHQGKLARINSIETLSNFVIDMSDGHTHIILGDFNFTPETSLHRTLTLNFRDARDHANHIYEEHRGTFNGFKLKGGFSRRIDYIFTAPEIGVLAYDCPDLKIDGRHLSDHFPVIATMRIYKDD